MARNTLSLNKNKNKNKGSDVEFIDDTLDVTDSVAEAAALKAEADKLEKHLANGDDEDRAALAQLALRKFQPSPYCRQLIELAVLNQCNEPSPALDADAREKAKFRKEILELARHDVGMAASLIAQTAPLEDVPNMNYSLVFNVGKSALFVANNHYRRALDPKANWSFEEFVDQREHQREAPYGLERDSITFEDDVELMKNTYFGGETPDEQVLQGLRDAHEFLYLIAQSFGWDSEDGMPYMYDMQPDGSFKPVYDAEHALDLFEVKRAAARIKREAAQAEARAKTIKNAAALAAKLFARSA